MGKKFIIVLIIIVIALFYLIYKTAEFARVATPDQRIQEVEDIINKSEDMPEQSGQVKCIVTGCSGQICAEEDMITTCEWMPEYACYKNAVCKRQQDGECGWTQTSGLKECLLGF